MIGQHFLKNSALKPSGPGDLLFGKSFMISSISFAEKGSSRKEISEDAASRLDMLKELSVDSDLPRLSL
jgi:hypothetical protein